MVTLGLGLVGIGRPWGHVPGEVPRRAGERWRCWSPPSNWGSDISIRPRPTARARSGSGASSIRSARNERRELTVATKFGEHWDAARQEPFVDHSFDALRRSLDTSMERLGRIDILQLHKTTPAVLASADVARAWEYALSRSEIGKIGPSVADPESARIAVADARYAVHAVAFQSAISRVGRSARCGRRARHVGRGEPSVCDGLDACTTGRFRRQGRAFRFILEREFEGVILTRDEVSRASAGELGRFSGSSAPPERQIAESRHYESG